LRSVHRSVQSREWSVNHRRRGAPIGLCACVLGVWMFVCVREIEVAIHRNTETPQHRYTETPIHRSSETPQHRNTETPKHLSHSIDARHSIRTCCLLSSLTFNRYSPFNRDLLIDTISHIQSILAIQSRPVACYHLLHSIDTRHSIETC